MQIERYDAFWQTAFVQQPSSPPHAPTPHPSPPAIFNHLPHPSIDDDEWDNAAQDLMSEGMPLSMSSFMVCWVLSNTMFHT